MPFMPRTHPSVSSTLSVSLCLAITYALILTTICAPFVVPKVYAARRSNHSSTIAANKAASPSASLSLAASATSLSVNTVGGSSSSSRHREGELIVRFRSTTSEVEKTSIVESHGSHRGKKLRGESSIEKLTLPANQDAVSAAAELRTNPNIEFVEPNYLVTKDDTTPNDPSFSQQWALHNSLNAGADINVMPAWDTTTGSSSTVIAIIDSGIDFSHPDLINNEWTNSAPSASNDTHGWDYIADSNIIKDEQGHGTAIAGIIASEGNNATGTAGVMWHASLMSLRVLDATGTGDIASAVEAIDYAASHGASVINLSWGTDAQSTALADAIERAGRRGVVVVCSAGNAGRDVESTPYYPASYGLPNMVSVAATDASDQLASWSNYGSTHVTVAAPGIDIQTTKMNGGYWTISGTSASAPLVAGVAGLVKTARPWLSASDTVQAIASGARRVAALSGKVSTGAIVNAQGALLNMPGSSTPPPGYVNGGGGGSGSGGSTGNGGGSNNGNAGNGNTAPGGKRSPRPHQQQEHGSGGTAADGSFNVEPPARTKGAPGSGLPNLDEARKRKSVEPKAVAPIPSLHRDYDPNDPRGTISADNVTTGSYTGGDAVMAALDEGNRTGAPGEDLFSGNYNWSLPLVGLKGRAGLDLGLSLVYNSLVWTKVGSSIQFDNDHGSPGPGFQLGVPILNNYQAYDAAVGSYYYEIILPSGQRVKMRNVGTYTYDSSDGSNLRLVYDTGSGAYILWSPDGTKYTFGNVSWVYRCTEIKDRNGNFITISYTGSGLIATVTDTLARILNFNYDGNNRLLSITQTWNGQTYQWATFGYSDLTLQTDFPGLYVTKPWYPISMLSQVGLPDGSRYNFEYTTYGQVSTIRHYAGDGHQLAYTYYNLQPSVAQTDCPRFTERHDWAENWNNNAEAVTYFSVDPGDVQVVTYPDGTKHKETFGTTGWQRGLTLRTEEYDASNVLQKWTTTDWTQDNIYAGYQMNPRPTDTNIYDNQGNRKRTHIDYTAYSSYTLPSEVTEYDANGTTPLRRTHTDYRWDQPFIDHHLIGLVSMMQVYDGGSATPLSKTEYHYDWGGASMVDQGAAVQHDDANYSASFAYGRGNLTGVRRFNVYAPNDDTQAIWSSVTGYNSTGSPYFSQDQLGHQSQIGYTDNFVSGSNGNNTLAYPTSVRDADGNWSYAQYNYDMGAVTRTQDPKGAVAVTSYDGVGRRQQVTNAVNNAYTRWVYPASQTIVNAYTTMQEGAGEYYRAQVLDGRGQVRATGGDHPGAPGYYDAQVTRFDALGRAVQVSNPTQIDGAWQPAADDAAGWAWTLQAYDWKGRPSVTTNVDGTTTEHTYGGCGCAGGEVVTSRDEVGRRTRATSDTLGRTIKTEVLNWDTSVYSTTTTTYNVRDQVTRVFEEAGTPGSSGTGQETLMTYDGHGRLATKKTSIESSASSYVYNADDTVQTATDARGASSSFTYNNRHLVTGITYNAPSGITVTAPVSFQYDAAGKRTQMIDGLGQTDYQYDTLSRLQSETRTFNGVGSYTLQYGYNLSGELTSVTDPSGAQVGYSYNATGQLSGVTGSGYAGISQYASGMQYRAWGALKHLVHGNGRNLDFQYNSRLQVSRFEVGGLMAAEYQYYANGQVRYMHNLTDAAFDRAYSYDHAGRLKEASSGAEARGGNVADGPYRQSYNYDVWGHLTNRDGRQWSEPMAGFTANYVNDRNQAWVYDAEGRPTAEDTLQNTYDAVGRKVRVVDTAQRTHYSAGLTITQAFDGDGQQVKQQRNNGTPTYYVRSSVLGEVICEITQVNGSWQKRRGYVYTGGQVLAVQDSGIYGNNPQVQWMHYDPVTGSQRMTNGSGTDIGTSTELDPLGVDAGLFDPYINGTGYGGDGGASDLMLPSKYGDMLNGSTGCTRDGAMASCDDVMNAPEGSTTRLPSGVSTIDLVVDHTTGDLQLRHTELVINGSGEVLHRRWVDTGVKPDPHPHDDPNDGVIRINTDITNTGFWVYSYSSFQPPNTAPDGVTIQTIKDSCATNAMLDVSTSAIKNLRHIW